MDRFRFVLLRPLQLVPVVFGISLITFVLLRLVPGDPARMLLGTRATEAALERVRAQYGLDEPIWVQYLYFLGNLADGELGRSLVYKIDVLPLIATRLEPTLALVGGSVALSLLLAVPLSALAARRRGSWVDQCVRLFSTAGLGLPAFWLGIMLILLFSVSLDLLPVAGYGATPAEKLVHLVLPCLTVALSLSAVLTRSLRASLIAEIVSDHAVAARARGLSESRVFWRHAMPNAMIPALNLLAVNVGWLIGGTVVIESVFAIPGLGQLLVRSIFSRDYMSVQGIAMCFALATVLVNFVADVLTVAIDPRVRL